ncbi:uncharacterized protein DS421_10g310400 [Arachis hypogaea]|nr:uncharacterized protein DS421_10g310400 [Arachis hypogaea]
MNVSQVAPMAKTTAMRRTWVLEDNVGAPPLSGENVGAPVSAGGCAGLVALAIVGGNSDAGALVSTGGCASVGASAIAGGNAGASAIYESSSFGGGGRFSTWIATFMPLKQNPPLPLMK